MSTTQEQLIELRDGMLLLKQDRSSYIKSQDVLIAHDKLCSLLQALDAAMDDTPRAADERIVDECIQLVSLLFLTVGRNNEPPAIYAPCVITKRLLDHLTESGNFSAKDLGPVLGTLVRYRGILDRDLELSNPRLLQRLDAKLAECRSTLQPLEQRLEQISPELLVVHEKLVSLRRCIKAAEAKRKFSISDIKGYLEQIRQIEATKVDCKFVGENGAAPEMGQEIVQCLLERSYAASDEAMKGQGSIAPTLAEKAEQFWKLKSKLERLELTQAWSLREADLYDIMRVLIEMDEAREDGKFVGSDGQTPDEGQSILLYLLRRSYAHVYTLINSSEPVSEALTPIFNQLQTVRRCLKEVQKFGIQDARELYPYSMKLASIDNMRVDGKFMVGSDIPEGQGRVSTLLAECFEICQELRTQQESD